ncbi:MAG: hypothetical protein VX899_15115 [Myxococcota bacterium]|nr:hypothetical protein [Myxococcota bacterium]
MNKLTHTIALLAALGLALPSVAVAQNRSKAPAAGAPAQKAPAVEKVAVQVMVVHAKDGPTRKVDPALKGMESHFSNLRYNEYSVLRTERDRLSTGETTTMEIEGGRKLEITVVEKNAQNVRMRVQMYKGEKKIVNTIIVVERGGTFILAGPQYQGGILILPITANY